MSPHPPYIGRFAPSPSGPLHFGSLVCALASYLDAKAHSGKWLVRIDDIDPPREVKGSAAAIIESLHAHDLHWDDDICYQSKQSERYRQALVDLADRKLTYRCACTRKRLNTLTDGYDGYCLTHNPGQDSPTSIRLNISQSLAELGTAFDDSPTIDLMQGPLSIPTLPMDDFIVHRKDGLFAYQLAVVVEDIAQHITHIIRGYDLLETVSKHRFLNQLLGGKHIAFAHTPLITDNNGHKLSKQNHAPAINNAIAAQNLFQALRYLKQNPPTHLQTLSAPHVIMWGIEHWNRQALEHCRSVIKT